MTVNIVETPGCCRWCGCTDECGCELGCGWANARHTLCTACVEVDRLARSIAGRKALAELVIDAQLDLVAMRTPPASPRPRRRSS